MGIAVATMVVFRAAMNRVDWTVTESACESGSYSQSLKCSMPSGSIRLAFANCHTDLGAFGNSKRKRRAHETSSWGIDQQMK